MLFLYEFLYEDLLKIIIMLQNRNGYIGVFDSGMGGLTVLKEIERILPTENILYYADALNCPYGSKSKEEILEFSKKAVEWLLERGVKIVVIACNTATSSAVSELRMIFKDIAFVAMEPAVKPAAQISQNGKVAILATERTIKGDALNRLCAAQPANVEFVFKPAPGLVEMIEKNMETSEECDILLSDLLQPILDSEADVLVLGCTHYPFLKKQIKDKLSLKKIEIIDASYAVAKQLLKVLTDKDLISDSTVKGEIKFYSSLSDEYNNKLIQKYTQYESYGN